MKVGFLEINGSKLTARSKLIALVITLIVPALVYWQLWGFARLTADTGGYLANVRDILSLRLPSDMHRAPLGSFAALLTGVTAREESTHWLLLVQLLMHGCAVIIISWILLDLDLPVVAAAGAAVLLWLPPYVDHSGFVLSESSAEFFLAVALVAIYLLLTKRAIWALWLAGIFCALAALARPTFQALSPLLLIVLLAVLAPQGLKKLSLARSLKVAVGLLVPFLALVVGWSSLNYLRFGYFGLTYLFGFNLSTRTVRVIERLPDSSADIRDTLIKYRDRALLGRGGSHSGLMYIWKARRELQEVTGTNRFELSKQMERINYWLILHAPLEYLAAVGRASVAFWFPTASNLCFGRSKLLQLIWSALQLLVNAVFLLSPLVIAFKLGLVLPSHIPKQKERLCRMLVLISFTIIAYNWLISCAFEVGNPRYRSPTDFLVVLVLMIIAFSGARSWTFRPGRVDRQVRSDGSVPTG